jgi:hypothetical protein
MSDDDRNKKTVKEGLSQAAREALEKVHEERKAKSDAPPESEREAAVRADEAQDHEDAHAAKGTPHGREDLANPGTPFPKADSDDEAPFATYHKIPEGDREEGEHRGPGRKDDNPRARAMKPKMRPALLLAEYPTPGACMHAAEKLRDAGYTKFDTHTPFPVHGMDRAMGLPDSKLGWIVLCFGLTGTTAAFTMMHWMNNIDYPIVIGGKPPSIASIPSMIPIMFELTVLFSALAAVLGMFHLNRLPRHHHPVFESDRFRSFSDDKFFVSVEVEDPKFKLDRTRELLEKTKAAHVELVEEEI